jgi:DsbC/DsbD-like thiol-disulfide interchange protein
VLEEIKRIQCHDVCLPTSTHGEIRLRCVTQPDELQSLLLERLGITLPKRLRIDAELPIALSA